MCYIFIKILIFKLIYCTEGFPKQSRKKSLWVIHSYTYHNLNAFPYNGKQNALMVNLKSNFF